MVYDSPAPVFNPYDSVDYDNFLEQKTEILQKVFNKSDVKESWKEKVVAAGVHQEGIVHTE